MGWITGLFGVLGSAVTGLFGMKQTQADTVKSALQVVSNVNNSNAQREQAIATIIAAEASSGYWLAAVWRPLISLGLFALVVASFFGYVPSNLEANMSPMMQEIFGLLKICLMGYIPSRTIDKIVKDIQVGRILKAYIEKKVL